MDKYEQLSRLRRMSRKPERKIEPGKSLKEYFHMTNWSFKSLYKELPAPVFKVMPGSSNG